MKVIEYDSKNNLVSEREVSEISHLGVVRDYFLKFPDGSYIELSSSLIKAIVQHEITENNLEE